MIAGDLVVGLPSTYQLDGRKQPMKKVTPWERWYRACDSAFAGIRGAAVLVKPPLAAAQRFAATTDEDAAWLRQALEHDERKWFVAGLVDETGLIPEALFGPMLDAGIDEVDPSFNRFSSSLACGSLALAG